MNYDLVHDQQLFKDIYYHSVVVVISASSPGCRRGAQARFIYPWSWSQTPMYVSQQQGEDSLDMLFSCLLINDHAQEPRVFTHV